MAISRQRNQLSDRSLHDPILEQPEARVLISAQAIERAMRRGLTREQAEHAYGELKTE
jgi:hypothetical protein